MESNRLLAIHIMELLNNYSSSSNTMSQAEIMERLLIDYGDKISRHTCSDYLKELRDSGYIAGNRGVYRVDLFSERELRTLIDGVMYGKHIPEKEAKVLIGKLKQLSANTMNDKLRNITYLSSINRTRNENLYSILDTIDEAIENDFKIEIVQHSIQVDGSKKDWSPKIVDPYFVVSDQSRYYLLCNTNRDNKLMLEPRRIDRFSSVKIITEKRTPLVDVVGHNFELGKYMREHLYMFSGEAGEAIIKVNNRYIGTFEDWYGSDYRVMESNEESSLIKVFTNHDALYYWILQYGGVAELIKPEKLRNKLKVGLKDMLKLYEE
ncbi:MAG: WYL domain-containing protein [Erysipelotrichaceae bacterium]|nr:WYL domain-containing protein [Erysipelotrichaceae bacterium]